MDGAVSWASPSPSPRCPISVGGRTFEIVADRGGVLDTRIEVALEPGWQTLTLSVEGGEPVEARVFVVGP